MVTPVYLRLPDNRKPFPTRGCNRRDDSIAPAPPPWRLWEGKPKRLTTRAQVGGNLDAQAVRGDAFDQAIKAWR